MSHTPLVVTIIVITVTVAVVDFMTTAEFVGSILFTLPLSLCALQPSKRLLWGVAAAAVLVTLAAEFWGFNRAELLHPWLGGSNRVLVIAGLVTLAAFIHLRINKRQEMMLYAAQIEDQRHLLAAQNEQLEILITAATSDLNMRKAAEAQLVQMESGQRIAEEALRESEQRYRLLLDGVDTYAIFAMDPQGVIVSWNAGAERIKGYRADQIIGRNFSCFFPVEDIERGRPEQILRMTAISGRYEELGLRVRRNGSQFLASVTITALRDQAGNLRGFSEFTHDRSESTASEAKYRGLLEAAPDAMVVVNQNGEIVLLNVQAERRFGYRRDELVGQQVKNIIPAGFAERLLADALRPAADALAQQIGSGIELTGRRKDGSEFPIEIMLSPLENVEGILVTAAIRDITARKQAELQLLQKVEELNRTNEELGQFAYIASHDLQEPLRMVASYTQLLAKRYQGRLDADADEFIAYAVDGSNRMQRMIHDLLAYSRAGSNGKTPGKIASEAALQEALANLHVAIDESDARVTHDPLPTIVIDGMQLTQLFQNLVGNAIKYRRAEVPHVHISAINSTGHEWVFAVRDNGLGIDAQYFERIFVLFQRLHGREEFEGTGIGLAICKKILKRLGGRIWVKSEPAKGSTFYFSLPQRGAT